MTAQEKLDRYLLERLVYWRDAIGSLEDAAARDVIAALESAKRNMENALLAELDGLASITDWTRERMAAIGEFCDEVLAGAKLATTGTIDKAFMAGATASLANYNSMLGLGGLVASFSAVSLGAEQIRSWFQDTPLGGHLLKDWVDKAFNEGAKASLMQALREGAIMGDGTPEMARRALRAALDDGFALTKREAITLARTYTQTANVEAQKAVYKANDDIIYAFRWVSVLDANVCPRCGALDGVVYKKDEKMPPLPLHPRCRCLIMPLMRIEELNISSEDLERVARPWARRELANIDEGGRRKLLEAGTTKENFSGWWKNLPEKEQHYSMGVVRTRLLREGKISFGDLVEKSTGRLRTLEDLGFTEGGKPLGAKLSNPVTISVGAVQQAPIGMRRAAAGTNPNYAIGTPYAENCQRCVPAYALRRWGWNVEAMPYPAPGQPNPCLGGFECFDGVKVHGFLGGRKVLTLADLQAAMQSGQEGDIYGIIWTWPKSQRGHVVACEIINGKSVFVDPQRNLIGAQVMPPVINANYGYSFYKMKEKNISQTIDWSVIIRKVKP